MIGKRYFFIKNYDIEYALDIDTIFDIWNGTCGEYTISDCDQSLIIEEAKKDKSASRWCAHHGDYVDDYTGCDTVECGDDYKPCNGKNGKCKHKRFSYSGTGILYRIYKNKKMVKLKADGCPAGQ